jgi:polar amino acid transport system ATP-binding protein
MTEQPRNASASSLQFLVVDDIEKSFADTPVLRGISFALKEKEILGVIGPSGGGKTTLLRCLDLLETIDRGRIDYYGAHNLSVTSNGLSDVRVNDQNERRPISEHAVNALRRDIGFVFQGFNLWNERTVLRNLVLAPTVVLGHSHDAASAKARELCERFGLANKLDAKIWQLSGGQQQRVAIIRALMMRPRLILLDEITSALDPVLTVEVMQAIKQLREEGLTMILVTHHIEFASSLCDRILFLSQGCAVQIDTPENIRNYPVTNEVRRFLDILTAAR